jgi:hypothetical protein
MTAKASLPLPTGSRVEFPAPGPINAPAGTPAKADSLPFAGVVTLSAPSTLAIDITRQDASAATTHAPAAPPTPAETATGAGIRVFYYLAAALAVAAVVCFYTGHAKAGIVAAAGAGTLPLLAASSAYLATHAAVAVVAVAGTLIAAWFFVRGQINAVPTVPNLPP